MAASDRLLTPMQVRIAELTHHGFNDRQIGAQLAPPRSTAVVANQVYAIARAWRLDPARSLRIQIALRWPAYAAAHGRAGSGEHEGHRA